jgi:nucleotide-binding universal stress UspA family protein
MLNHILVPLDGSPRAESVLPHAIAVTKAFNTQITLVQILDQQSGTLRSPRPDPLDWYLKKSAANLYLESVQSRLAEHGILAQIRLEEGFIAEKIAEIAHTTQVDLLILSGYGETSINAGSISSMVQNILQRVRISTLIVRENPVSPVITDDLSYKKVMVALDCSQRAGSALPISTALAEVYQPELLLVHVVKKPEMPRQLPLTQEDEELVNRVIERNIEEGSKYLNQVKSHLPATTQTRLLVSDNVAVTLQTVSEQENIDLLILSAHGYSGEAKWPYGSVTSRFITDGTTPLLIVQDLQWTDPESSRANVEPRQPTRLSNDS